MSVRRRTNKKSSPVPSRTSLTNGSAIKLRNESITDDVVSLKLQDGVKLASGVLDLYSILSMVIGGCCANVWAYEQLLMYNPTIGSALTFSQMLFITIYSLPTFLAFPRTGYLPRLKPRQVPLTQWGLQVLFLIAGSLLNNWAFSYKVPLTVQIVFRSAGLPISMIFGFYFSNKRYSFLQITSVIIVTAGVVLATLSRPRTPSSMKSVDTAEDLRKYVIGISMLVVSLFCTGSLGLLQERTYKKYGPCWKEGVFYTHFLSLPIFLLFGSDIKQGIIGLSHSATKSSAITSYFVLAVDLVSQLICVSGVNRLSSKVSSVSTNIALTVRKALSLCFSVWWFGNQWNTQLGIGATMVFIGSLLYTAIS